MACKTVAKTTCVNLVAICSPCLGNLQHRTCDPVFGLMFSMPVLEMVLLNVPIHQVFGMYASISCHCHATLIGTLSYTISEYMLFVSDSNVS